MTFQTNLRRNGLLRWSANVLAGFVLISGQWVGIPTGAQQQRRAETTRGPALVADPIERAANNICQERTRDRQGTIPIDEMAVQNPLPFGDPSVIAGRERAQRLLPVVKRLLPSIISRLALVYQSEPISRDRISARLALVNTIKPDMELRDNAAVRPREPHAITFGTIFLAGLRSDEAMAAVLAHELTHVADGPDHILQALFNRIGRRAFEVSGVPIQSRPAIELTCELVGVQLMQEYLRAASASKNTQRLARAFQKDCVSHDLADDAHLSPRETLRVLLMLEPDITKAIGGAKQSGLSENGGN